MAEDGLLGLRVTSLAGERTYILDGPAYSIGRTPDNEICVPVATMSAEHARLVALDPLSITELEVKDID